MRCSQLSKNLEPNNDDFSACKVHRPLIHAKGKSLTSRRYRIFWQTSGSLRRLTDDWNGADFLAVHFDGSTFLRVQSQGFTPALCQFTSAGDTREAMIESARLRAVFGESGLTGNRNDRIQNESMFNLGTDVASIEANRQASLKQTYQQGQQIRSGRQSQMNQIQRPGLIGTGLQIAGVAVESAATYKAAKNKLPAYVTGSRGNKPELNL